MKVKVSLLFLLLLGAALGYMLGTESGRAQRDMLLIKLGRKETEDEAVSADAAAGDPTAPSDLA